MHLTARISFTSSNFVRVSHVLGLYDEIWQRARRILPAGSAGVATQDLTRRGYLEVQL